MYRTLITAYINGFTNFLVLPNRHMHEVKLKQKPPIRMMNGGTRGTINVSARSRVYFHLVTCGKSVDYLSREGLTWFLEASNTIEEHR